MSDIIPHLETLLNFMINTLPKPILISLLYRLSILQVASSIIPLIGSDGWTSEEDEAQTPRLAHILLTYRQFIFVAVFSQMILLDHSSQVWWRWINIFFTLSMWGVELSLSDGIDSNMKMD
jgi:arginine exporter protein ArgO